MGLANGSEVEMLRDAGASRLAESARESLILEQALDRRRQGTRVPWLDEETGLSVDDDLGHAADARGHDRQACRHRFENREREPFGAGREYEDLGVSKQLGHVAAFPEKSDRGRKFEASCLILDRLSLWAVPHENGIEVPPGKGRQRANEREGIFGRLQPPHHHEAWPVRGSPIGLAARWLDAVTDDERGRLLTCAGGKAGAAFVLGNADRHGRQPAKDALRPPICGSVQPFVSQKGPPVDRVDANGHTGERSCETAERGRLRAVDVDDVRPTSPQKPKQLERAEEVPPWIDGAADVPQGDELRAGSACRIREGTVSVRGDDHVEIRCERFEQGGDVRLRASGLGERDEENEPRSRGQVILA